MKKMGAVGWVAFILVVIGGLNWGLVGAFDWNLVDKIFTEDSVPARVIYVLVGLSALYMLFFGARAPKQDMSQPMV